MLSLNCGRRGPVFLLLLVLLLFQQSELLMAETYIGGTSSSIGFSDSPEVHSRIGEDLLWLAEADRLMGELVRIDVQLHSRLVSLEGEELRRRLIRERNNIRRLMVELVEERNVVLTRLKENQLLYERAELSTTGATP